MSEQAFQEKVKLTKEQMNEALEAQVDSTMNALMSDESFSEEQRGEVRVWLKQIYYLGKEHGRAETVIDHIPEDAIDKMVGVFEKIAEQPIRMRERTNETTRAKPCFTVCSIIRNNK